MWLCKFNKDFDRVYVVLVIKDNGIDMYCFKEEIRVGELVKYGELFKKVQMKKLKEWMQKVGDINDII